MPGVSRNITLAIANGLHLAPITRIVQSVGHFECSIKVAFDGKVADARSVYDLMLLGATKGAPMVITAEGSDAELCLQAVAAILEDGSGDTRKPRPPAVDS